MSHVLMEADFVPVSQGPQLLLNQSPPLKRQFGGACRGAAGEGEGCGRSCQARSAPLKPRPSPGLCQASVSDEAKEIPDLTPALPCRCPALASTRASPLGGLWSKPTIPMGSQGPGS